MRFMPVSYEIFLYLNFKLAHRLIVKYLPTDSGHLAVLGTFVIAFYFYEALLF
ncbi:hypothetical protein GXM_01281 [Nostoc sphaeroides CCNUC1]|uniref:Uncharacterized protein n=1 Tax=Nostoc sphaeroides CCNUC1 TaxID=2653204 RepID=A0A5P8VTM7_9NOSO|nr:hypothetical protein GXM_01281 [Nostoc sphaeroides CCNUC1]